MLSFDQILLVLWRRRWTFLLTLLLVVAGTAAVTFSMAKTYEANTYLLVASVRTAGNDFEATQTNQVLSKTYAELLQTRNTADAVAQELSFSATGPGVQASVQIRPITQSQLIQIRAVAESPRRAKEIADTYARVFVARVREFGAAPEETVHVTVGEEAALESAPIRPRPKLYLLIGAILGTFLAGAAALVRQRFDQRLEIEPGATELFGLPVLGRIPQRATSRRRDEPLDPRLADAFRLVLANVRFANLGGRPRSLAVVSAGETEGKSTCALNLAQCAVELGIRVLLVDGDLRRPGLTTMMRAETESASSGFSSLLLTPERIPHAIERDGTPLRFVAAGPLPPNPAALLGSEGLAEFERVAKEEYELVVFDTPPLLVGADATLVAAHAEGVVMVVDVSNTRRTPLLHAIDQLRRAQANVLGVILNRAPETTASGYYYAAAGAETEAADAESFSAGSPAGR